MGGSWQQDSGTSGSIKCEKYWPMYLVFKRLFIFGVVIIFSTCVMGMFAEHHLMVELKV